MLNTKKKLAKNVFKDVGSRNNFSNMCTDIHNIVYIRTYNITITSLMLSYSLKLKAKRINLLLSIIILSQDSRLNVAILVLINSLRRKNLAVRTKGRR